jgi:hypothetical protein
MDRTQIDEARRRLGRVPINPVMRDQELAVEPRQRIGIDGVERDLQVVALAAVADIGGVADRYGPGTAALVYYTQDLKNYCRVTLFVQNGRVASFSADHAAPEFFGLRDGSNYCGRMEESQIRACED